MGLMVAVAVVIAVLAALTLLPAVFAIVSLRIDALRVRPSRSDDRARPLWARWAARIARKPFAGGLRQLRSWSRSSSRCSP